MAVRVSVAGRMMLKRVMGKASFATVRDSSFGPTGGRVQAYINNDGVGAESVNSSTGTWATSSRSRATVQTHRRAHDQGPTRSAC